MQMTSWLSLCILYLLALSESSRAQVKMRPSSAKKASKSVSKSSSKWTNSQYEKYGMPTVGRSNCSQVVEERYKEVEEEMIKVLNMPGWSTLKSEDGVTIENLHYDGFTYQRHFTVFESAPSVVRDSFDFHHLDNTQRSIDQYYEQINNLHTFESGKAVLMQKTTTRLYLFAKRIFELAYLTRNSKTAFQIDYPLDKKLAKAMNATASGSSDKFTVAANIDSHVALSVRIPDDFGDPNKNLRLISSYVRAYWVREIIFTFTDTYV
jgi:hypothetical protein